MVCEDLWLKKVDDVPETIRSLSPIRVIFGVVFGIVHFF